MNTGDQFRRICEIFEQTRELAPENRQAFLRDAIGDNQAVLDEVNGLLAHHDQQNGILDNPVLPTAAIRRVTDKREHPLPKQIGQYEVVRRLGMGGMGVVYLARQSHPAREVAVKVMRAELVNAELEKRFALESTLLGRLQHPGIAQIFEASLHVENGVRSPFFAMEYVKGPTLGDFIRDEQPSIRARLNLFQQIANAVQHAHQKGVIHRDLKPSNILIQNSADHDHKLEPGSNWSSSGPPNLMPKILDFGVARSTESDLMASTFLTDIGQLVGTLPYMSPEQVNGKINEVDTRSDVYALGVILYEMLADKLPYELNNQSIVAAARTITESQPTQLSSINRSFRGDLNTIVQKALEKDPDRRYESAIEFASDIHRYLNDQPLFARPASKLYQIRKFTKRNKALVGGILTTFAVLLAGIATTAWQAQHAKIQREIAVQQAKEAKQLQQEAQDSAERATGISERLYKLIMLSNPAELGPNVKVIDAMKVIASSLDESPPSNALAEHALRNIFAAGFSGMGEMKASEKQLLAAAQIATANESVHGGSTFSNLGALQTRKREFEKARINLEKAAKILSEFDAPELVRAKCMSNMATLNMATGNLNVAERNARDALAIYNHSLDNSKEEQVFATRQERSHVAIKLGGILDKLEKPIEAQKQLRLALEIAKRDFGERSARVGECLNLLAVISSKDGKSSDTVQLFREALEIQEANFPADHPHLANLQFNLGQTLRLAGELQEAEGYLGKSIETYETKLPPDHPMLAKARTMMAELMLSTQQFDRAEELFQTLLQQNIKTFGRNDIRTAVSLVDVAKIHEQNGDFDQAESLVKEAITIRTKHYDGQHSTITAAQELLKAIQAKKSNE